MASLSLPDVTPATGQGSARSTTALEGEGRHAISRPRCCHDGGAGLMKPSIYTRLGPLFKSSFPSDQQVGPLLPACWSAAPRGKDQQGNLAEEVMEIV